MNAHKYVELRAPEFHGKIDGLIELADLEVSERNYGDLRYKAVALQALHWASLDKRDEEGDGKSGHITSIKEGQLAKSFSVGANTLDLNSDLTQTRWGLELLQLQSGCFFMPTTR